MVRLKILFLMLVLNLAYAQQKVLDRIVAIVGNEVILESDLNYQTYIFAIQNNLNPNDPNLKRYVLEEMINDKLILTRAIEDTIVVSDDEVDRQIEAQVQALVRQYGSERRLEEIYGMPLGRIKRELREDVKKRLMIEKLKQQKFGTLTVSGYEVEQFYNTYKDSLPEVPETVELYHIMMIPKPVDSVEQAIYQKAKSILDSIRAGGDFKYFAETYSDDKATAKDGGDLGWVRRGMFVKEFEEAVFRLQEGQISDVVRTQFGYHIIQLIERRGEQVHPRHILFKIPLTEESDKMVISKLEEIRYKIISKQGKFEEMAKKYSEDEQTRMQGGYLGMIPVKELEPELKEVVSSLSDGDISQPIKMKYGNSYAYHIVFLKRKIPAHRMDLKDDYMRIYQYALIEKQNREYQKWVDKLREEVYVYIDEDFR
ncbi:periplasmic chaperone for outer membrane proteins SurA [Candidatus Kryptonium thompsonii]|uniref:peptidylprolyl isomerase n=1 Tax=Candidatus Kryptonium thompsonii TaxID=1633631 RepID=A0A0P1NX59_9BACT|nr:peptidylprolyl isomerase [Candidatus Kryptonium thompsoni]CUS76392.1 periplasmic chaperone for outer membrane proteins SurA [Candidatus Kryptonium thompsoni]CUS79474.1 periplasmic chaperone for outer membrane proteins SurA [Candidatus Kryptonium thompsoni]CUS82982.1 periplasmic chaperone for outer membrane proteins SurA [Candidatus Kryptonium thompsoni]CUS95039.1 periplasmic chaperone for outer membrane proteins SurA [Candidatus Kryptonium thompsoni]CUS95604.1 periplasmic chaperone for oute